MATSVQHKLPNLSIDLQEAVMFLQNSPLRKIHGIEGIAIAIERYRKFLYLISRNPLMKVVPTEDIDEIWHFHMLHPVQYYNDCMEYLGFILNHNPGFGFRQEDHDVLINFYEVTKRAWQQTFQENYKYFPDFGMKLCRD